MQYKKPKKPGEFLRKVNASKHHKSLGLSKLAVPKLPKLGSGKSLAPRTPKSSFNTSLGLDTNQWKTPGRLDAGQSLSMDARNSILKKRKPKKTGKKHHKNWIAGAIKHPGALHRQLGIKPGKKIPAKTLARAASKGGKLGRRARLAQTLKHLNK